MRRRALLTVGAGSSSPGGPIPSDPSLTTLRGVTQLLGVNQNDIIVEAGGLTWRSEFRAAADLSSLIFAWGSHTQQILGPWTVTGASYESPSGVLTPLTFGGSSSFTLSDTQSIESDPLDVRLNEADLFHLRLYVLEGVRTPADGTGRTVTYMSGDHRSGAWVAGPGVHSPGPSPVAVIGKTRPSTVCPALIGDSIAASGHDQFGWWRLAVGNAPALSYGRNARTFGGTDDGRMGDTLRAATHALVEYGSNDLRNAGGTDYTGTWSNARATYAYIDAHNPGIPMYQSTCLPVVDTSDMCATLAGQTVGTTTLRVHWNAWLRDGAPIDPVTKAALAVGASGLRCGDVGHPLAGIIDTAATVEEGGIEAPTGKWRIGPGGVSWGGDGTHPTDAGQVQMAVPTKAWHDALVV